MKTKKPELVSPAGNWSALLSAVEAGADAVYFGIKEINMRYQAVNFDILELKKIMARLRKEGRRGYLALNVLVYDKEIPRVEKILKAAKRAGVDAVIGWDMAVLSIAKEQGLKVHLSTQASVSNFSALSFYAGLGIKRVVLARECGLSDIREITLKVKREKLDCNVEAFVHGAMCVSISGRCFLSYDSFGKSANRGECLQPCRREYDIIDSDKECGYVVGKDYILSAKDLCAISFIDELIEAGIDAFKIEGRMRQPEYVKVATSCYRRAIDAYYEEKLTAKLKKELTKKLKAVYHRGFSDGFYFKKPSSSGGKVQRGYDKVYLGEVKRFFGKIGVAEVIIRSGVLKKNDEILISGVKTPANFFKAVEMEMNHKAVEKAGKGEMVGIKAPFRVRPKDKVFIWKKRKY